MRKRRLLLGLCGAILLAASVTVGIVPSRDNQAPQPSNSQQGAHNTPPDPAKIKLACVEKLPDSTRIGQKLMFAGYSGQLASSTTVLSQANIGGVIIMNQTPASEIATFRTAFSITPTIAIDQEGGTVQRYKSEGIVPGAATIASSFSPNQAYQLYLHDDTFLKSVGFTTNFAPVLDVVSHVPSPLPGRMYSADPSVVSQYAASSIRAAKDAGIAPVVKHFPGLGSTTANTDFASATTDPLASLKTRDLLPYQQVAHLQPDAMVSSAIVPDLTNDQPAIWSAAAVTLLRSHGYQNAVIYTDSLTAAAVPGTLDEATLKAWQAGIDVALIVQTPTNTASISSYIRTITSRTTAALRSGDLDKDAFSASVLRILDRKGIDPCAITSASTQGS